MTSIRLNKVCEVEDFTNPVIVETIRSLEPDYYASYAAYPAGMEHRKSWEFAQLMAGVRQLGVLGPDSLVLAVAAGHERPVFALTRQAKIVFVTDIYGTGDFSAREAQISMLTDPDKLAPPFPYNRNRLVVQHMNALDLRYEDNTFDLVFSLSSIEHFGTPTEARTALEEMHRVCRPGGVVMLTTECIVNGSPAINVSNLQLFTPSMLEELMASVPGLEPVEPVSYEAGAVTRETARNMDEVVTDLIVHNRTEYPHVVLETGGAEFTSISLFMRKVVANA